MKYYKIVSVFACWLLFSSCLKTKNDFAGLRTDNGGIVVSILEDEYIDQDNNVIGFGYQPFAHFDFGGADEDVKFFTAHITQTKDARVKGTMKLTITAQNGSGTPVPAGAITIPATYDIPAFDSVAADVPIMFKVNKSLLDPNESYSVVFTITGSDQGAVSLNKSSIEVVLYPGKYYGRYTVETTVTDPLNVYKITSNTKPVLLDDLLLSFGPRPAAIDNQQYLSFIDEYYVGLTGSDEGLGLLVDDLTSGTSSPEGVLIYPTYHLDASGKVDGVFNTLTGDNYNVTFTNDLSNQMVYTDNAHRTMEVSYDVVVDAPAPGGTTQSRKFHVQEKYKYHLDQVRIFY